MTTQSVKTQTANLFGNQSINSTKKEKQSGTGFEAMISNNMKLYQSVNNNSDLASVKKASYQKAGTETKKSDKADNYTKDAENVEKKDSLTTDTQKTESRTSNSIEEANTTNTQDVTEVSAKDTDDKEKLTAEISAMMQAISEIVMQTLNLTEEEFGKLLEEQGMNISDLLDSESLQQLLLASNGETDILSVLTDENLAKQMKELLGLVEERISQAGLKITKEQLEELLSQSELKVQGETFTGDGIAEEKVTDAMLTSKQPEAVNTNNLQLHEEGKATELTISKDNIAGTLQTEETNDSNTSSQQNTSDQESGAEDHFQTFIDNLVKTTVETKVNTLENMVQATELREIANQIIDRIKVSITPDQTSMELQLNPENLGKVNLTLQSKNGVMTAQFVVQNEVTKEAIESQMHILRESLDNQGIKVEAIEVTVSSYTFDHSRQEQEQSQSESKNNTSGKKISLEEALTMVDDPEEAITEEINLGLGSQVDYTA